MLVLSVYLCGKMRVQFWNTCEFAIIDLWFEISNTRNVKIITNFLFNYYIHIVHCISINNVNLV